MKKNNIEKVLKILEDILHNNEYIEDIKLINNIYSKTKELLTSDISLNDLEIIKNNINYLEIKYDTILDLSYYFDPVYISIKRDIHKTEVEKLRKENRKKKEDS